MQSSDILVLTGDDVLAIVGSLEREIMEAVGKAYVLHRNGDASLPHSTFLRFPEQPRDRIIALPAYLGGEFASAGMKWIASFPGNHALGIERASAVMVMNSTRTGRAEAIVEGSVISAKRTAASAALAARELRAGRETASVGFLGCGLINHEIARFLAATFPPLRRVRVCDLEEPAARRFAARVRSHFPEADVEVVPDVRSLLDGSDLVSIATTALAPFVDDLSACPPGAVVLHVSLRDISAAAILTADNVVDDLDHVCRAETSVHLAEQLTGNRDFVRCSLADILSGAAPARRDDESVVVFSPFGLGILDVALGTLVVEHATRIGIGSRVPSFFPDTWHERA